MHHVTYWPTDALSLPSHLGEYVVSNYLLMSLLHPFFASVTCVKLLKEFIIA